MSLLNDIKSDLKLEKIDLSKITYKEFIQLAEVLNRIIIQIKEQHRLIEEYFNKPNIANFIINEEGYYVRINKHFTEITEYTFDEIKSKKFYEIVHPDFMELVKERGYHRLSGEPTSSKYEFPIITKTGKVKWVLLLNTYFKFESSERNIILGTALDITKQKELIHRLNEQYKLFKALIESINQPIWVFDVKDHTFKMVNNNFYKFFEIKEDVIGKNPKELFNVEVGKRAIEKNEEVIDKKKPITYELVLKFKSGEKNILINKSPVFNENGEVSFIVGTCVDMTEKIRVEKELSKIKKLESLGILAGGIAHDFNNILTAILGNISILQMYISDKKPQIILNRLENAVNRAKELTNRLLTFSKGSYLVKEIGDIVENVKSISEFVLAGSDIVVKYEVEDNIPNIIFDKSQISEVLHNIILNARQALEGCEEKKIFIRIGKISVNENEVVDLKPGNYIKISIKDTGIGIDKDIIDKIFDPFFTTKIDGSGIGLAISYSIVKKHGGTITVKSEKGKGSLFEIYLPMIKAVEKEKFIIKKYRKKNGKLKILVLEDEKSIQELLKEFFTLLGHEVDFADKGEDVVKFLENDNFYDIIICDMTIKGGMGGIETIKKVKEIDPEIYAIICSGYTNSDAIENYRKYGFNDCLIKPFTLNNVKEAIEKYFNS